MIEDGGKEFAEQGLWTEGAWLFWQVYDLPV